ncbi:unnamed protein product [Triticum turgidum subsp. durum]|uniref:Cytochrome P450 n=1 Tax=Triticum turgidum subsp. durum TaxID=4567 RepID=A0A9R1RV01_TRITD|nr:unnamed protein product [Triticum turgidum subsp. durum]
MSMGCEKHDLLSRFMASQGESYTETALRDVVISFLLAGRETTSSALTWFFWLLSSRPDVERRIREEVAASVWGEDARAYRPERWLDPDTAEGTFRPESPFRYIVFHAGPRICLGKEMAYIQMKSIVACVVEELEVAVDGGYTPRQVASLTLRMADGLPVMVKARS